jgi:hypothetical protein
MDRFCNLVWYWLTRNAESEKDVRTIEAKLWRPPPGSTAPALGPWSAEAEMKAFSAFKAAVDSGGKRAVDRSRSLHEADSLAMGRSQSGRR